MPPDILRTNHDHTVNHRQRQAQRVINLGLTVNALLAIIKVLGGIIGHSKALLADGINSVSDVIYLCFVKLLVKLSGEPADEEHPYGHHQLETIAAVVIGAFIVTTGLAIFWDAINSAYNLLTHQITGNPIQTYTLGIAILTVITKIFLLINAAHVGQKIKNLAITALARDHRNDIFSALGATIGILGSLGGWAFVDPLAGTVISVFIIKTGIGILKESTAELMDTLPNQKMGAAITKLVNQLDPVINTESVHLHRFGPYYVVNITIGLPGEYTIQTGDDFANRVEELLYAKNRSIKKVYVHYHPRT